jgi:multicomponent Na+:H+ antiporter subunit C
MSGAVLYGLVGVALFVMGLFAAVAGTDPLRRILAVNVSSSGVFLTLMALARRGSPAEMDPVPQAMVITGIVVAVSATALAVVLIQRLRADGSPGAGNARDPS